MSRLVLSAVITALLTLGCKKPAPSPAADAPVQDPSASSTVAPPSPRGPGLPTNAPSAVVVPDTGNIDATLNELSLQLRRYVVTTRSVPRSFEEFAAKSSLQAPPPPAGKKYAIQGQLVVLVKR
ncbi:MAG TPA: hypothetical protein VN578_15930 [Candidatus Binatia bacterium]|nr:hypothetical protein [Candidatus Binatia bacterium]